MLPLMFISHLIKTVKLSVWSLDEIEMLKYGDSNLIVLGLYVIY